MITLDLFEQDPNFRKPVEYETRKQFGTVNFANFIKAYQSKPTQPVQFDFPGGQSYKLSAQWVDMLADYYNTLETNPDRAQLIYGTLIDYNKTLRFLNTLAQQKLFEKKSSSADPEFKSAKLARLKTQARAKYPAAANDMEAMAADFVDELEKDQKEVERVKSVNRRQDELLKKITALNKEQNDEIKDLESEEAELQRNIQQIQSANAELAKKLADMSARRSTKKDSTKDKEQQATATTAGAAAVADFEPAKTEPTEVEPEKSTPVAPAGSAMADIVKVATGSTVKPKDQIEPVATSTDIPSEIPKQPDNIIDLFPDSDISEPEKQPTSATKPDNRDSAQIFDFPTRLQKSDDEEVRTGTNNESVNENKIPAKQVMQGYVVEFDPKTNVITIGQRGQVLTQFKLKLATRKGYEQLVNKFISSQEDEKYPDDVEARDVALPTKRVGEGSVFGQQDFDTQMDLAKLKSQLTQPKPAQSAPASAEPQPVPARLSDLQSKKQRVDNLASIKQEIEKLQARATRGGRMLPRGLAADLEDYFTTADIDTAYDDMIAKYQKQLGALQQYLGMRKTLWAPKKDVHEMRAKELQESREETWTAYFTDGTKVTVTGVNDETDPARVRAFFAKKGKTVERFDYGFKTGSNVVSKPESHEPGSGTARSAKTGEELPEGDVVNINRSGHNAYRDKNDWLDKRDYVQQQLLDPRQRDNYPELKQRLLDINYAGRKLGYTK
jgi:hypothetical protein